MKKFASVFSIIVGISMILMWGMFYFIGSIPEIESEPYRIIFHIIAEIITAVILIVSGIGLLKNPIKYRTLYYVSSGALLYTVVQSAGYFIEHGDYPFVGMFAGILAIQLWTIKRLRIE